jgi:hypothetical protein
MDVTGLNENHERRLATAIAGIDAAAARLLDLLEQRNAPQTRTVLVGSLSESEGRTLRAALRKLQAAAAAFGEKYALKKRRRDLRRIIVAELSQIWTTLEDLQPDHLRGYGVVPHAAARELERDLVPLQEALEQLLSVLEME